MKICLVGPGIMPIPPNGWGAVESIIWDCATELGELDYDGVILNTPNEDDILSTIEEEKFDFIHIHYDVFCNLIPDIKRVSPKSIIALSSHYPYIDQYDKHRLDGYNKIFDWMISNSNLFYNFCVSDKDLNVFKLKGVDENKLHLFKTGAQHRDIKQNLNPKFNDRSICIGKIDKRKMQFLYQSIDTIDFVGPIGDLYQFNTKKNYMGEWTRKEIYDKVGEYSNIILLSMGENGTPLVIKEALMSGLGVVTSEYCAYELDTTLPFISIIPTDKLKDLDYVNKCLIENREVSISMRKEIIEYAIENFSWERIIKSYIETIIKLV
jgi:glycosyltransferase involved in cell wall biosynthesis